MNICFLNSGFPPSKGGVATHAYELALNSSRSNQVQKIKVIAFGNIKPRTEKLNEKIEIKAYSTRNFFLIGFLIFIEYLNSLNFKYFHATNLFPVGFWTVFWSKLFFKKSIVTFYGTDVCATDASQKTIQLKRWTIDNADKVIPFSNFTKKESKKFLKYKRDDLEVCYTTIPLDFIKNKKELEETKVKAEEIKSKLGIQPNDFILLTVCHLVKRKGVSYIIDTVKNINDERIKLLIVGRGPEKENLEKQIKKNSLERNVFLLGEQDPLPYYLISDLFIFNSFYIKESGDFEGLGIVCLEAQALGIPVIGTKSGGIPEAIDDGRTGFIIPERDPRALKEKILLLKNNKKLYNQFSEKGPEFVKEKFDPVKNTNKYLEYIKR